MNIIKKKPRDFSRGRIKGEFKKGFSSVVITLTTAVSIHTIM